MTRLVTLLLLALIAAPAAAQRSYVIRRFDATIKVTEDGSVDVRESITAEFTGAWNGIYRTVPVDYRTPQGFSWALRLDLLGATSPEGQQLKVESSRQGHSIKYKIWVPGAENATRTVVLHYRARNGLRFFPDHDELYWNVTGDEWDQPIEAATALIELPARATGVRAIAFNGVFGSTARDARVELRGTTIRLTMPRRLEFHEGLTAVVGWDKGVVPEPTPTERTLGFLASNWPLAIPIPVFLGMFLLWSRVGRDPRRLPVVVRYEPPDAITPAEAGTLMDNTADMRDITATVVDLAVRGHLRIEERPESHLFGLLKRTEYVFHRMAAPAEATALAPHEASVLSGIFGSGRTEVPLSDLENDFYRHLPEIRQSLFARLVGKGLYRSRPDTVRSRWLLSAGMVGGLIAVLGGTLGARLNLSPLPVFLAAGLSVLIVAGFAAFMPARTVAGARVLERVLGFEEFLRRVDAEHYQRVVKTPEMFERFLPYAMTFRVERRWAKAFEGIYREPPTWYVGSNAGGFSLDRFSSRLADLSSRTESTLGSSPRSSGGSGFSGGSSGGGSGGGGGGAF
jgi:uncharacterized membrane protein YgcG